MVTDAGINFFDFSKKQFFNRGNNPKNISIFKLPNIKNIALDEANIISYDFDLQTLNYFSILKEQVIKELPLKNIFHNKQVEIRYIFADKQHNLWLSDWFDYCYYYDIKTQKAFPLVNDPSKPTTIAANSFWAVYEHKGGSIWLGTNDGISITNPVHNFYEIYDLALLYPKLKNENQLYSFLEDSADNTWWLSATPNSFVHYYPKTNQLEVFNIPFIRNQSIQALIDYQNNIYVVASESFLFFDKKKKKLIALPLPDSLIANNHIAHTMQKGDSIWFFGNNSYAYSYKISTQKWTYYPILTNSLMDISCSEVDNHGDIWIAIQTKGLAKFSRKKQAFELVNTANDLEFKKIWHYAIQKDTKGNFWIGSFYEVIEFDPITQKFHNSLDVNVIADMIVDKNDNIWTAAYNDISVFFPNRKKSVTETIPINKGNFNMNWRNSLYCLKNGQIISLIKGNVVKIFPSKLISSSTKDKVLISKITLVNDEILLHNDTSAVDLASSENGFSVYFSTLNPPDEQKYKYTYQLSNYNKSWVSLPNNNATFSNLDGGDYVFQVKGIDNNGYETPISRLKIHIDTVFYKSKWFLYGCVFLICSLFYAFMRFRAEERSKIYHLRMQSTRLEKDKTEIQYQNLINHLNPHFLFNSLTSLNSLIMTEPKEASKFLQKLSLIYRYILQNKDKDIVSLEQEVGFVKHYINLQKSRFEDGLQINISIEKEYLPCGIVPVTLQNLLENAIKHNTIEEDNPLIINVLIKDNYLLVRNNLQKKKFVETSNKQGLESLKSLYKYLTNKPLETVENDQYFTVKIPLL
jgi:sensor histidine kinase YesM/streptogramin lyase